jgi:hypothetical protein
MEHSFIYWIYSVFITQFTQNAITTEPYVIFEGLNGLSYIMSLPFALTP